MSETTITVKVEDAGYKLFLSLIPAVKAAQAAKAAGATLPQELAAAAAAELGSLMQVIADIGAIGPDLKANPLEFAEGSLIGAFELVKAL